MPEQPPTVAASKWHGGYPPLVPSGILPGPVHPSTEAFWILYDHVTDAIREEITHHEKDWNSDIRVFLEYLIGGFFVEYEAWPSRWRTRNYLKMFHTRAPYKVLRLVGHAYLHIAYDLPRVVADFQKVSTVGPNEQMAYLRLEPGLARALEICARKRRVFGQFAVLSYLPGSSQLLRTLVYWTNNLRSNAIIHGNVLANSLHRHELEIKIFRVVYRAAATALDSAFIPTSWLPVLRSPLFMLIPIGVVVTVDLHWWHAAVTIGTAVLFYVVRLIVIRRAITRFVDTFGFELSRRLQRLFESESG